MSTTPIVSVDEVCKAIEVVLAEHLDETMTALRFARGAYGETDYGETPYGGSRADYQGVTTWQQVPTAQALAAANMPAGAIVSPGLVSPPRRSGARGGHEATWRVPVGIYDRGLDHDDTAARIRNWCAGIRTTVLHHKGLGGIAKNLAWVGESYALMPDQKHARTVAGGVVTFDVTVDMLPAGQIPTPPQPVVTTTPTQLTVQ